MIGSSSCVLSVCSHVFYFMYGVCFRGQFPLSFIMFHDFITHFAQVVTCFILHLSLRPYLLVLTFSRAHNTHSFH